MKIKNKIDMIIGLAIVRNNFGELSRAKVIAEENGIELKEINRLIEKHLTWTREQGYESLLGGYLNPN